MDRHHTFYHMLRQVNEIETNPYDKETNLPYRREGTCMEKL